MDLYLNNQRITTISIHIDHSIGQLKKSLNDWLVPQGYTNYAIKFVFNNGTMLDNIVFESSKYDNINFQKYTKLLYGGRIIITTYTSEINKWTSLPKDVIIHMTKEMSLDDIYNLCLVNKHFNDNICNNMNFWIQRLYQDFNVNWANEKPLHNNPLKFYYAENPKEHYENLYRLKIYKEYAEKTIKYFNSQTLNPGQINLHDNSGRGQAIYIADIIRSYHTAVITGNIYLIDYFIKKYSIPTGGYDKSTRAKIQWDTDMLLVAEKGYLDAVKYFYQLGVSDTTLKVGLNLAKQTKRTRVVEFLEKVIK